MSRQSASKIVSGVLTLVKHKGKVTASSWTPITNDMVTIITGKKGAITVRL